MSVKEAASETDTRARARRLSEEGRALPNRCPAPPDAAAAARDGYGTCASKHALLAERLRAIGIESAHLFVVGPLVPPSLCHLEELRDAAGLLEVHECLTVFTPWAGPLLVDVTWDPPLLANGLQGVAPWDGASDMPYAIVTDGRAWAAPQQSLRAAKEAIRARLYTSDQRAIRDRALAALSTLFGTWRDRQERE